MCVCVGNQSSETTNKVSDYAVHSDFWQKHHEAKLEDEGVHLDAAEKEAASKLAVERDNAIVAGKFIPTPRFTIERAGYDFREGEFGFGYYETSDRSNTVSEQKVSAWPKAFGGSLRVGIYKFTL